MQAIYIGIIIGIVMSLLCIISFTIGARIGQKVVQKEEVRLPSPVRAIQEYKDAKEIEKEYERNRIIAENIDNYDGTSLGQQDVPR